MRGITFIGPGPLPSEISELYVPDAPPPQFRERYEGEYSDVYRANGYEQVFGVWVPQGTFTLRQLAMRIEPYAFIAKDCLYGPLINEEKVVLGGFAWWRQKSAEPAEQVNTLLRTA